eukprot:6305607-Lingulodinium_polyedra.AAC.1
MPRHELVQAADEVHCHAPWLPGVVQVQHELREHDIAVLLGEAGPRHATLVELTPEDEQRRDVAAGRALAQ